MLIILLETHYIAFQVILRTLSYCHPNFQRQGGPHTTAYWPECGEIGCGLNLGYNSTILPSEQHENKLRRADVISGFRAAAICSRHNCGRAWRWHSNGQSVLGICRARRPLHQRNNRLAPSIQPGRSEPRGQEILCDRACICTLPHFHSLIDKTSRYLGDCLCCCCCCCWYVCVWWLGEREGKGLKGV